MQYIVNITKTKVQRAKGNIFHSPRKREGRSLRFRTCNTSLVLNHAQESATKQSETLHGSCNLVDNIVRNTTHTLLSPSYQNNATGDSIEVDQISKNKRNLQPNLRKAFNKTFASVCTTTVMHEYRAMNVTKVNEAAVYSFSEVCYG